jgi:hypothetical protein
VWSWAGLRDAGGKENLWYLSRRIDNLSRILLVLILDHLAESILNRRIVAVYEMTIDELHRHTRLAWTQTGVSMLLCLLATLHVKLAQATRNNNVPTALLPTMATFLCLGGAILLLCF